jgi:hypothetical protein
MGFSLKSQVLTVETDAGQRIKTSTSPMPGAGCSSGSQRFRCFILAHRIFPKRQKAAQMVEFLNLPGKPFSNHFRLALDILGYCSAFH